MQEISVFWLRVAVLCYLPGLIFTLVSALRKTTALPRWVLGAFGIGAILHLVALVDLARQTGQFPAQNFFESISLCALLLAALFLFVNWRYRFESLAILVFPLVFLMTLISATSRPMLDWPNQNVRDAWLIVHVILAVAGFAALFIAAAASVFYIVQEHRLKSKQMSQKLPPLATLDTVLSRSMSIGFVMITLATAMASVWGFVESGTQWVSDPKIAIAWVTWLGYLLMVSLRVGAGWRGRKVAITAICVLGISVLTWATHYGIRSQMLR